MYAITTNSDIPDSTYFTMSDVTPECAGSTLTVWNGKGTRRSWGAPGVESTVVVNYGTFAAVHVGFHHKHRGGQGWFYFVANEYKTWAQLTEAQQKRVLKAFGEHKAPFLRLRRQNRQHAPDAAAHCGGPVSKNTGHLSRHCADGKFVHECAYCGVTFRTNRKSDKYCCFAHKEAKNNATFYGRHRQVIILVTMLRQARKAKRSTTEALPPKPRTASTRQKTPVDEMTQEQLLEYIRNNPHQIRPGKTS